MKRGREDGVPNPSLDNSITPFWDDYTKQVSDLIWSWSERTFNTYENDYNGKGCDSGWFNCKQYTLAEGGERKTPLDIHSHIISNIDHHCNKSLPQLKKLKKNQKVAPKLAADKSRKIKLYPSEEERTKLNKWMGTCRWIYNKCLEISNNSKDMKKTQKDFRTYIVNSIHYENENQWVLDTPYDVRDDAAADLLRAFKSNFQKKRSGQISNFMIHFKRRKDKKDHFTLRCKHWKQKKGDFAFIKNIKSAEKLPDNLDYDSIVFKNALNEYYLCIPQVLDVRGENQAPKHSGCVVALDPGIITFQSTFDTNGYVSKWGTGDVKRITRLCLAYDKLQSKWTLTNHKKRYKYKKAGRRIQKKIRNLVDDLHKKLCLWLCRNYRAILLPSFETKSLKVDKETRQTISA